LNNRGQFSIIAALLISIILVSTVMLTYTVILNDSIQVQPQVLTAIDETNFAIKQMLGFSVGYYGSVIRVTGDTSFANQSTFNYTTSGLEYVANTHAEWGAGFSLTNLTVHTYWFNNTSYSTGYLSVTYNLTKLGIYGVQYAPSCGLTVQIVNSTQNNQTSLIVTRDQNEPITDLEQQNFQFFQYQTANSTWTLVSPATSPVAYTNGTYQIQPPAGIDAHSYVVQVEDQRGIIVVASPFSSYVMDLTWPSTNAVSSSFGNPTQSGSSYSSIDANAIVGGSFTSPAYAATVYNFTFYGRFSSGTHNVKAVLVLASNQHIVTNGVSIAVSIGTTAAWYTGTFPTPPTISPSTAYVLMVIPDTSSFNLYYTATTGGTAYGQTGDSYSSPTDPTNTANNSTQYSIYANCNLPARAPATDTLVIELLQNGTMRWLGQSLQNTTQSMPIPPLPVKSIHVNQTINGVDSEVPFQIEDWASNYLVPLGLTGNSSVFNDGNMIVFLVNNNVSRVTIWWNGSDLATQTPYAFVNRYFKGDNPSAGTLTNGMLTLQFGGSFTLTSTNGSSSCTATFMRLNGQASTYGASPAYVIASGVVRDIVQQEAEWSNGAPNSPNLYAHIVLTLPANATYYTYELRALFVQSQQNRTIWDLCPIELQSSITQALTENGTTNGYPIVSNATGTFYNQSSVWAHHWSQLISGANGAGIMFTDAGNSQLYSFDSLAGTQTGELRVNAVAGTIELLPVEIAPVSFTYPLNAIWCGAVSTFSNTTPIYQTASGQVSGSWLSVEYPPTLAVYTGH